MILNFHLHIIPLGSEWSGLNQTKERDIMKSQLFSRLLVSGSPYQPIPCLGLDFFLDVADVIRFRNEFNTLRAIKIETILKD